MMNDRLLNNPIPPRELESRDYASVAGDIYRALERDPANRYPSAEQFARDLRDPSRSKSESALL